MVHFRAFLRVFSERQHECLACYTCSRPSVTMVDQPKTVKVRIMQFSPSL